MKSQGFRYQQLFYTGRSSSE